MGKVDVWQGTLALMILKTVEALGPLHGYGMRAPHRADERHRSLSSTTARVLRRLLKLEQEGALRHRVGHVRERPSRALL